MDLRLIVIRFKLTPCLEKCDINDQVGHAACDANYTLPTKYAFANALRLIYMPNDKSNKIKIVPSSMSVYIVRLFKTTGQTFESVLLNKQYFNTGA